MGEGLSEPSLPLRRAAKQTENILSLEEIRRTGRMKSKRTRGPVTYQEPQRQITHCRVDPYHVKDVKGAWVHTARLGPGSSFVMVSFCLSFCMCINDGRSPKKIRKGEEFAT